MFLLYQLTGLFELAWMANPDMAAAEISKLADVAKERGHFFVEDLLRRCIVNLAHGRPVGYFGDELHPIEHSPQARGVPEPEPPPSDPPSEPRHARRARRKSG